MTVLEGMKILERFKLSKDELSGFTKNGILVYCNVPSKANPNVTVADAWYICFKAFLKCSGDTVLPEDMANAIINEFSIQEVQDGKMQEL